MIEVLGLVEHVLAEHAFIEARRGDGAHVMHMTRVDRLRELDHAARALDVHGHLRFLVSAEVVNRREVVEVVDLALQALDHVRGHAELLARQVAVDRNRTCLADAPVCQQVGELPGALLAHQEVDRAAAACQQLLDESLADEAGRAGDEVFHGSLLLIEQEMIHGLGHKAQGARCD